MILWNRYRVLFWLALCSSCLFFSADSFAVGAPTTYADSHWNWAPSHTTPLASCIASDARSVSTSTLSSTWVGTFTRTHDGLVYYFKAISGSRYSCLNSNGISFFNVNNQFQYPTYLVAYCLNSYPTGTSPNYSCPTCPVGTQDINGFCVYPPPPPEPPPPDPCLVDKDKISTPAFGNHYFASSGYPFADKPVGCFNSCKHSVLYFFSGPNPIASGYFLVGSTIKNLGSSCDTGDLTVTIIPTANIPTVPPETDPDADGEPSGPSDCPPGTGFGQVNNKNMCLPAGTSGDGPTTTTTSSAPTTTTTNDPVTNAPVTTTTTTPVTTTKNTTWTITAGGSPTYTTTTTSSNGPTTKVTTTTDPVTGQPVNTTTTTPATGGSSLTTTTTSAPGSAGVGSGGSGSGASGSGGSGDGEGVNFGPAPVWSDPGNGGAVTDMTVGGLPEINWHQTYLPEGGACALNDIPLEVMGVSVTIPLSQACPYFPIVYGLVVFMSVLASIRLFAMAPW